MVSIASYTFYQNYSPFGFVLRCNSLRSFDSNFAAHADCLTHSELDELATKSLAVFCFRLPRRLCVRLYRCIVAVSQFLSRFSLAHVRNAK